MDRLTSMEVFATVAKLGSFSAAAGRLDISSTAVSRHVSNLEDHLGVRLINRTTRTLSLTDIGFAYLERSREILTDIDDLERTAQDRQASPRGTLKMTAPISFGCFHLTPAIAAFMERHPALSVDLTLSDRHFDLVEEGYEVAVRIGHLPDSSLIARKLAPSHMAVYATPAYLERNGSPAHPNDLKSHNCIITRTMPSPQRWPFVVGERHVNITVGGNLTVNNSEAVREAVLAHAGVGYSPTFFVGEALAAGRVVPLLREYIRLDRWIYVMYPHNRHLSAKVRLFVDFVAEHCNDPPYWDSWMTDRA